ncbi:WhiB family transcriptional regulator [Kitasatospora sp. P5_F3]
MTALEQPTGFAFERDHAADWREFAACAGLPSRTVFATRRTEAAPALDRCGHCPVRSQCLAAVQPDQSWFDGVCGGRLWRNGRAVSTG